jgi:hypothetical protein
VDAKLNAEEFKALQSLDPNLPPHVERYREGDLPQRLFAFNLVSRQPSGKTVLTKRGQRALFRQACLSALTAIDMGQSPHIALDVHKWLTASGFLKGGADESAAREVSSRGLLWIAASKEDPVRAVVEPTAEDFARRRA